MFTHGEEFLKVYLQTEKSIMESMKRRKSLKKIVFEDNRIRHKSLVFKLTIEVLKYEKILSHVAREIFPMNCDSQLLKIGIYDLCIGEKSRNPNDLIILETQFSTTRNSALLMALKKRQECMKSIQGLVKQMNVGSLDDLVESTTPKVQIPKYIRINRHQNRVKEFLSKLRSKYGDIFRIDELMDFLLVFPHDFKTHKCSEVRSGQLIVQDKASCLPSYILNKAIEEYIIGEKSSLEKLDQVKVIDSCAAPGNKTSLISEYFPNDNRSKEKYIFAFEKNFQRFQLLKKNMRKYGVSNVLEIHQDFLKVNVSNPMFCDVRCALVDPSCTGSGIVNRINVRLPGQTPETEEYPKERIRKLSNFQSMVLQHAMKFPSMEIVVYSTCSIMEEENEGVIREILSKRSDFTCISVHNLLSLKQQQQQQQEEEEEEEDGTIFGRFGIGSDFVAKNVVRTVPEKDRTNGFFVAVLVKKSLLLKKEKKKKKRKRFEKEEEEEESKKKIVEEEEEVVLVKEVVMMGKSNSSTLEPPMKKRKLD